MGRHIERHAVERELEISAMIELEAAKLILIGLALAAVLRDHETGNRGLQRLARTTKRNRVDLLAGGEQLAGRLLRFVELFLGALDLGFGRGDHDRGRRRGDRERRRGDMRDHGLLRLRRRPGRAWACRPRCPAKPPAPWRRPRSSRPAAPASKFLENGGGSSTAPQASMSLAPTFLTYADFSRLEPSLSIRRRKIVASVSILSHSAKA